MPIRQKEFNFLKKSRAVARARFGRFGVNKTREIVRLLYEIAKRENIDPDKILPRSIKNFAAVKDWLVKKRFPYAACHNELSQPYLPKLELNPNEVVGTDSICAKNGHEFDSCLQKKKFYPKQIFVEKSARRATIVNRFKKNFPRARVQEIGKLKDYIKEHGRFTIADYNHRRDTLLFTNERYDFFKKCPCTRQAVNCGYHIFDLGFGCIFECTYCYLQDYVNSPGVILPANLDIFFDQFSSYKKRAMRIGTGEFSDSLMLDNITEYSLALIDFFRQHPNVIFEFKTKSNNIGNLLKARHANNIVVSWSVNPQKIIDENEFLSTSLNERIEAANKCVRAGHKIGLHFDPIFYFPDWEKEYEKLIDQLFTEIKPKDIAWISLGTFRFGPGLKKTIEKRFPANTILDTELLPGYDKKLRYPPGIRYEIYRSLIKMMSKHHRQLPIYLCMEEKEIWKKLRLTFSF